LKPFITIALLLFIQVLAVNGQTNKSKYKQLIKAADQAFTDQNYYGAALLYHEALQLDSSDLTIVERCADLNRQQYNNIVAAHWYRNLLRVDANKYPYIHFNLAETLKDLGEYEQAKLQYEEFLATTQQDSYKSKWATYQIEVCKQLSKSIPKSNVKTVQKLKSSINTEFSELGVFIDNVGDTYITAIRPLPSDSLNIKAAIYQVEGISEPRTLLHRQDTILNVPGLHTGNITYSQQQECYFISRCEGEAIPNSCKIYSIRKHGNQWTEAIVLPEQINYSEANTTQPSVAQIAGKEYLLFASDRQGGYGKTDIWACQIFSDGGYGAVFNLGSEINSLEDELTPFFNQQESSLYFSSKWFFNMGAFDIFRSKGDFVNWNEPENLGYPINTNSSDLYYYINPEQTLAYFSSNRSNQTNDSNSLCCNDIYSHIIEKPKKEELTPLEPPILLTYEDTEVFRKNLLETGELTLYFPNDMPDPKTRKTYSKQSYTEVFEVYKSQKDHYIEQYTLDNPALKQEIEVFFETKALKSYSNLLENLEIVEKLVKSGKNIRITLKSYTSPLASSTYNKNLSQRRLWCVVNMLYEWKNGELVKYIEQPPQKLTINMQALGESQALKIVSDRRNDQRNSVFSPFASSERRVNILIEIIE